MASENPYAATTFGGMVDTTLDLQNIQMNSQKIQANQQDLLKGKIELNQTMTMLRLMQGLKPGAGGDTPDEMSDLMDQMSIIQLESGMPQAAAKSAEVATKIRSDSSLNDYRAYRLRTQRLSQFSSILDTVPDSPDGFRQAMMLMQTTDPEAMKDPKFQQIARMGWKPGLMKQLKDAVLTQKDKSEIKYRQQAGDHAAAAAKADEANVDLIRARTQYYKDRDKLLGKEGAKPPKSSELQAITDQITRDFPGADPADARVRARPLAEEMNRLISTEHLTLSQAATRVYQRAKSAGVFQGMRLMPVRPGSSPNNPLPMPSGGKKPQQNMWYTDKNGEPVLVIGNNVYTQKEVAENEDEDEALADPSDDEEVQMEGQDSKYPEEETQPDDFKEAK